MFDDQQIIWIIYWSDMPVFLGFFLFAGDVRDLQPFSVLLWTVFWSVVRTKQEIRPETINQKEINWWLFRFSIK